MTLHATRIKQGARLSIKQDRRTTTLYYAPSKKHFTIAQDRPFKDSKRYAYTYQSHKSFKDALNAFYHSTK